MEKEILEFELKRLIRTYRDSEDLKVQSTVKCLKNSLEQLSKKREKNSLNTDRKYEGDLFEVEKYKGSELETVVLKSNEKKIKAQKEFEEFKTTNEYKRMEEFESKYKYKYYAVRYNNENQEQFVREMLIVEKFKIKQIALFLQTNEKTLRSRLRSWNIKLREL